MEKLIKISCKFLLTTSCFIGAAMTFTSCDKDDDTPEVVLAQDFAQVNLVASSATFTGARVDANFINGWGIAFSPTGNAWISSEGKGTSVIYDKTGAEKLAAVTIPSPIATTGGSPTGQVFNGTTDFVITGGASVARFIFAGTDGVISGWSSGGAAVKLIDRSSTSAYTGLAIGVSGTSNYLYAANFRSGKIDVFDKTFAIVSMSFTDPNLPAGYAPFNIQAIGTQLYVLYAKVDPTTHEEQKGAGFGYVSIFNMDGTFVKRFVSEGALNAPWGIAQAPTTFMDSGTASILIGNFGDGKINAYDLSGNFLGNLRKSGVPIVIDGLWAIAFAPATATTVDPNWLFFAAGPADETQGLYGYVN